MDTKGIEKAVTKGVSNASLNVSNVPSINTQKGLKKQSSGTPKPSATKTKRTGEIELSFALVSQQKHKPSRTPKRSSKAAL